MPKGSPIRQVDIADYLATPGQWGRMSNEFPGHEQRMASHVAAVLRENPESVGDMRLNTQNAETGWRCSECGSTDRKRRSRGLCQRCYFKAYRLKKKATTA